MIVEDHVQAVAEIKIERINQERLKNMGRFEHTAADAECTDYIRLAMLTEELGEVARALQESDHDNLVSEVIQVGAIAVAWLEYLIAREKKRVPE